MRTTQPPVLTGLDDSPDSTNAVMTAAAEANVRGLPLRLVISSGEHPTARPAGDLDGRLRDTVRRLRDAYPALEISTDSARTDLPGALVDRSRDAGLIVVGPADTGGHDPLFQRWLTHRVVTHARCPVLVARARTSGLGQEPVVVGVDGSEHSTAAVPLAFEEASLRGVPLRAINIHCVRHDPPDAFRQGTGYDAFTAHAHAERLIEDITARWTARYPSVKVESEPTYAPHAAAALLSAATTAALVVVGARGRSAVTSLLLGSTSRALVEQAACPVLVAHAWGQSRPRRERVDIGLIATP